MKNKSKKNTNINKDEDNLLNMYIEENKNIIENFDDKLKKYI